MAKIMMPDGASRASRNSSNSRRPDQRRRPRRSAARRPPGRNEVDLAEATTTKNRPPTSSWPRAGAQTGVKLAGRGRRDGARLCRLVALANGLLGGIGGWFGVPNLSFQQIVGWVFQPIMFLIGVPWAEAGTAGGLFGTKIVLNEFVASSTSAPCPPDAHRAQPRHRHLALCGFANFSSIAIQMAVTGGLAPNQRPVIARLGIKALIAGSLANLMSAALAGLLLG
jgi:CNT family concentrative nucleoside transporter